MPEGIVDDLELVEVDVQQRMCLFRVVAYAIERADEGNLEFLTPGT